MPTRCPICPRTDRAKVEAEARAVRGDLGAFVDVAAKYNVTRAKLEKHLEHAEAPTATRRRKRAKEAPADQGPPSGRRPVQEAQVAASPSDGEPVPPLPPPRELESPDEELRRRARLLTQHLERPDLDARQLAQVSNALGTVDRLLLARAKLARPIEEHPDFEGLVEDLVVAVVDVLGPDAENGIEARIARRFEELQTARTLAERRAA